MRHLVTGDWHVGVLTHGKHNHVEKQNSRLVDVRKTLRSIVKYAKERKVDVFVQTGDVFHTCRPTPLEYDIVLETLAHLEDAQIHSRFIAGNHDYTAKLGDRSALYPLQCLTEKRFKYVRIYSDTFVEKIGDAVFVFYPYGGSDPDWERVRRLTPEGDKVVLVCHSHLEGALVGSEPYRINEDKATRFRDLPVDAVYGGHFHKPQKLSDKPLVFYPGSIQHVDFSERTDQKGVVLVETEGRGNPMTMQWKFPFNPMQMLQVGIKNLEDLKSLQDGNHSSYEDCENRIVKILITIDEEDLAEYDETAIQDWFTKANAAQTTIQLNLNKKFVPRKPDIVVDQNLRESFDKYVEDASQDDLNEIRKLGMQVIREVEWK